MAGETILYVDDNFANRVLVNRVLQSAGYTIVEAETGLEGVKVAEQHKPDLILMDINLPDIDGYQATDRIRQIPSIANTPVIALTANAMVGDREKALKAGCDGYISKPVDVELLPVQVNEYISAFRAPDGTITKTAATAGSADIGLEGDTDGKSEDGKSAEAKPAETKAETKPVETKDESTPAETSSTEKKDDDSDGDDADSDRPSILDRRRSVLNRSSEKSSPDERKRPSILDRRRSVLDKKDDDKSDE